MSDADPNLENAYFLTASAARRPRRRSANGRESRRGSKRAIDAVAVVVGGGTNVEPNHRHGHRAGGGFPPVRFQGGSIRQASEVRRHA